MSVDEVKEPVQSVSIFILVRPTWSYGEEDDNVQSDITTGNHDVLFIYNQQCDEYTLH